MSFTLNGSTLIERNDIYAVVFHIILALLAIVSKFIIIAYIFLTFILFFNKYAKISDIYLQRLLLLKMCLYVGSFELIGRILGSAPLIPYELSKYLFSISGIFIVLKYSTHKKYSIIPLILLIVSLFLALSSGYENSFKLSKYVFNFLGPFSLSLLLISYFRFPIFNLRPILNAILYPLIVVWVYCLVTMPDLESISLTRDANEVTTGGFGSNQVSTALGVAMFIVVIFLQKKLILSGNRLLDYAILFGVTFQALLSFSRGGVFVAGLAVILFIVTDTQAGFFSRRFIKIYLLLSLIIATFFTVNSITGGFLKDRYQGRTAGVIEGSKELNLNTFTTGRFAIFMEDLSLWLANPFTGVGIGNSSELREQTREYITHSEFSRLLSEQGVFGGLFFISWVWLLFNSYRNQSTNMGRVLVVSFATIAILTTFHAAMRTFTTPIMSTLAVLNYKFKG